MTDLKPVVEAVMQLMQERLRKSLEAQGHTNRGRLAKSIEYDVKAADGTVTGTMYFEDYGVYVNVGVKAANVRYPIQVMIDWWQDRGLSEREATRAAWATRAVHKREGIPTRASSRFSETGQRTGFVEQAVEASLDDIGAILEERVGAILELRFSEAFRQDGIRFEV